MRHLHSSGASLASTALIAALAWCPAARAGEPAAVVPVNGEGAYVSGAVGALWPFSRSASDPASEYRFSDSFSGGFSAEVGVGYDFGALRTELSYSYDGARLGSYSDASGSVAYTGGQQGTTTLLLNAYWDIQTDSRWTPYLGAGIGYGWQNQANSGDQLGNRYQGYRAGAVAWQAKAGVSYSLTPRGDLFAEVVYRGLGGFTAADAEASYSYDSFNRLGFQLGSRWRF